MQQESWHFWSWPCKCVRLPILCLVGLAAAAITHGSCHFPWLTRVGAGVKVVVAGVGDWPMSLTATCTVKDAPVSWQAVQSLYHLRGTCDLEQPVRAVSGVCSGLGIVAGGRSDRTADHTAAVAAVAAAPAHH